MDTKALLTIALAAFKRRRGAGHVGGGPLGGAYDLLDGGGGRLFRIFVTADGARGPRAIVQRWTRDMAEAHFRLADCESAWEAALCAVVAGYAGTELNWPPSAAEVLSLVRDYEDELSEAMPNGAQVLLLAIEDDLDELSGVRIAAAVLRVRTELKELADHLSEEDWAELYRLELVRRVMSS